MTANKSRPASIALRCPWRSDVCVIADTGPLGIDLIAKIDGDVFNRLVTLGRILSEAFAYDALKFQGRVRVRVGDRRRLAVDDLVQRVDDRVALERLMARGGFIQNAAEGKNIRARIDRFALRLFGRHMPMVPMTTP